jgi:hypothetical protein
MLRTYYCVLLCLICFSTYTYAQRIGISETNAIPNANAILDIKSSTKGVLLPRTSTTTRLTMPDTKGMLVYDTTIGSYCYNTGSGWLTLEATTTPAFSTLAGYWKGTASNIMTMVHHPNGTSRLYLFPPDFTTLDTTGSGVFKVNGNWQLNGTLYTSSFGDPATGAYRFSAIVKSPALHITGMVEAVAPNSTIGLTFYMIKQ